MSNFVYNALSQKFEDKNSGGKIYIEPTVANLFDVLDNKTNNIIINGTDISALLRPRVERLHSDEARRNETIKYQDLAMLAKHISEPALIKSSQYDPDLKKKAVEMIRKGYSAADISAALDIKRQTIHNWKYSEVTTKGIKIEKLKKKTLFLPLLKK